MMASTWSRYHFLTQRFSLGLLLSLVLTLTWPFTVTGSAEILPGEVGGNVTFQCPVKEKHIDFLYLQRGSDFVNGYYGYKELPTRWNNTKLDRNTSSVFMNNLKVSHSGEYTCHIRYRNEEPIDISITLSVTAKYSRPVFSPPVCDKETQGQNCQTTCTSNNGYPKSSMIIQAIVTSTNDTIRQTWEHVKSVHSPNSSTSLYNIATTVNYNCSNGEIKFSCSVGDVTSDEISVCARQIQDSTDIVIVTAIFILVVVVMIAGVLCWRRRTGGSMRLQRVNTNEAVEISLCEKNGEKEAA